MTRDEALAKLRPHEQELRAVGLAALYLFGSTARNTAREDSDVDLLFDVGDASDFSLLHQAALQLRLAAALGRKVDLLEGAALRPRVREQVERDLLRIF